MTPSSSGARSKAASGCAIEAGVIDQPELPDQQHQQRQRDVQHVQLHLAVLQPAQRRQAAADRAEHRRVEVLLAHRSGVSVGRDASRGNRPCGRREVCGGCAEAARTARSAVARTTTPCTASAASAGRSRNPTCRLSATGRPDSSHRRSPASSAVSTSTATRRDADEREWAAWPTSSHAAHGRRRQTRSRAPTTGDSATPSQRRAAADQHTARRQHHHRYAHRQPGLVRMRGVLVRGSPRNTMPKALVKHAAASPPISASPAITPSSGTAAVASAETTPLERPEVDQELADEAVERRQARDRDGADQERAPLSTASV